jgi:hypothetical protein
MSININRQKSVPIHTRSSVPVVCSLLLLNVKRPTECCFLERSSSTTRALLFMAIPGHLTFVFVISRLATDQTRLSILFIFLYLIAALIQVGRFSSREMRAISMFFFRLPFFSTLLNGWWGLFGDMNAIPITCAFHI